MQLNAGPLYVEALLLCRISGPLFFKEDDAMPQQQRREGSMAKDSRIAGRLLEVYSIGTKLQPRSGRPASSYPPRCRAS